MRSASKFFTPGKEWVCSIRIHPSLTTCCMDDIFSFAVTPLHLHSHENRFLDIRWRQPANMHTLIRNANIKSAWWRHSALTSLIQGDGVYWLYIPLKRVHQCTLQRPLSVMNNCQCSPYLWHHCDGGPSSGFGHFVLNEVEHVFVIEKANEMKWTKACSAPQSEVTNHHGARVETQVEER